MDCRIHQKGVSCWLLAFGFWLLAQPANSQQLTAKSINWRDSLATLQKEIARQPWSTDLHLRKAAVNLELAQWQYAIDEYGLILERDVQNPAALYYRGYAHTQLRHYDMARRDYEELLSIFPRHTEARMALSYVLQLQGRQAEALDQLNQLVEQRPDSAVVYAMRAALERDMKQYEASRYDWQQASRLEPKNVDYVVSQVDVCLLLGRKKEARRLLDAAVKSGVPRGVLLSWYEKCKR